MQPNKSMIRHTSMMEIANIKEFENEKYGILYFACTYLP